MPEGAPLPAGAADDAVAVWLGGSGSLPGALPPPATVAGDGETVPVRLGGPGSLPGAPPPPATVAGDGETVLVSSLLRS